MTNKTVRTWVFVVGFVLVPMVASAQGIKVTSVYGPVEVIPASGTVLTYVDSEATALLPILKIGDQVRTGPDAQMTLELSDGSYVVVSENTTFTVEEHWGSSVRNLMRVMLGKVRFHIQKLGGVPNPYRVNTPTALIAVRGTDFDVIVEGADATTEVRTYEGLVRVVAANDREVMLEAGFKTLVRSGQNPLTPVGLDAEFGASRTLEVVRKDGQDDSPDAMHRAIPSRQALGIDNDRRNRTVDPLTNPNLNRSAPSVLRGKLTFP
jgi:hypothetical protein